MHRKNILLWCEDYFDAIIPFIYIRRFDRIHTKFYIRTHLVVIVDTYLLIWAVPSNQSTNLIHWAFHSVFIASA